MPGLTSFKLVNRGYYDHRHHTHESWEQRGCKELIPVLHLKPGSSLWFSPPGVRYACSAQSYYDITGSGGDVYLVKNWHILKNILKWAGTEYIYVQAGYLADQPRATQIIEDMIAEGP